MGLLAMLELALHDIHAGSRFLRRDASSTGPKRHVSGRAKAGTEPPADVEFSHFET